MLLRPLRRHYENMYIFLFQYYYIRSTLIIRKNFFSLFLIATSSTTPWLPCYYVHSVSIMTKICIFISRLHLLRLDHVKQIFFFISVLRSLRRNHVNFFPLLLLRSLRRDHDKKYIFSISALSVLCLNQNKKHFFPCYCYVHDAVIMTKNIFLLEN